LMPATMTFVTATPPVGTTYNAGTGIWNIGALASGQSRTLTIVAYPNPGTSGMTIADTASYFSSTPPDNNAADNSLSVSFTVNRPDLLITKTVNDNTPNVGQTILYTIKAKNQGSQNAPATGLVVTDVLPTGLTYVPGSSTIPPGTTYNPGTGAWTIGTLNDNVELTLVLAATVNAGQTGLTKTNTASVTAIDQPEEGNFASTASVNITVNFPDIQMTKTVSNGPYNENVNLTYTVTVKNNGPVTATNVVVKDLLPGVLSYQSHSTTLGAYVPGTGLWTVGTLNSGQDEVLTIVAQPITGSSGTAINNVALLYSMTENDPLIANNSAGVEIEVATVDLLVEKSVNDASPSIGQLIEYSVKLTNLGLGTGTNIIVKDILPPGLTFSSFTQIPAGTTATHSSGTITWTDPTMAPSNQTLKFEVTVDAGYAAKTIVNTAYVEDLQQVDPNPANSTSSVSVIVNGADLALTKTVDNPAPSTGATIVYKIKLRNNGPLAGNDVTISDLLPAGVTYVSHTVSESAYNPGTGVWGGTNLDMAIGEEDSLMITATVTAPNGSLVTNTATITSQTQPDDITANNTASVFFVVGNADVSLTKSVNGAVFFPGDPIVYTLTITNNGPFQAAGFSVADTLPAGVTFTSASATLGSYSNATGLWTFGTNTLAVGASATLTINATVNAGTAGFTITNTGKAISVQGGNNTANDVATATFKVHGADISVTKTASASTPNEGDPLTYTISVTNNGPDPTTSLIIKDLLPINLDFVSATGGTYNPVNGEWNIGALANGATVVLTINTTIESGGGITNTAYVLSSSEPDNVTANNTASVFVSALKNFAAGACIINMGQVPQTYNNTLKAYGLVYELVKENMIPVYWAIRPNKTFQDEVNKVDEIDFSVNGVDYKTGAFIIDADYVSIAQPIINEWTTLYPTLQVNCNQPAFSAPIFNVITSLPRAVLDEQNGGLIESAFYDKTGLDNTIIGYDGNGDPIYSLYRPDGLPSNLSFCDDIYAMPHADPHTWSTLDKETFDAYIKNGGWLWSACHAPSSLETLVDVPSIPGGAPDMNYLTVDGLVLWGDHSDGTLPYSYSTDPGHYASEAASDPFMQFIGNIDEALQSGSEQIYIPFAAGWRPTTTIAMWDPDHPERTGDGEYPLNAAALVAYGRAYGNPDYGMLVYEASHSVASGTEAENVGAARIYGNFWLAAGIEFQPMITPVAVPDDILSPGELANFALTVTGRTPTFTYQWMSDCGGTFSNPTSATTTFTAPMVSVETPCVIRCVVTDECGRLNFFSQVITIAPSADLKITKTSTPDPVQIGQSITYTITVTNLGPDNAQAVSVKDTLPASLDFVSATPSAGTWTAPTWSVGNLALNASATLTIVATVNINAVGSIINKAYASSNTYDPVTTNNVARDTTMLDLFPVA
ncbi:MAG: DUF11 domain-containing protein, partial [Thermoanaerobaculia bacterium]|nr:DUF11 domain-containing protein [Thermoanaerobaculia bacterium]